MNLPLFRKCLDRVGLVPDQVQICKNGSSRNSHSEPIFLSLAERLFQTSKVEALQGTSHDEGCVDILYDDAVVWLVNTLVVKFPCRSDMFPFRVRPGKHRQIPLAEPG